MDFEVTIYLIYSAFVKDKQMKKKVAIYQLFCGFKKAYDLIMSEVLHNSGIECVINMKPVILIKM